MSEYCVYTLNNTDSIKQIKRNGEQKHRFVCNACITLPNIHTTTAKEKRNTKCKLSIDYIYIYIPI